MVVKLSISLKLVDIVVFVRDRSFFKYFVNTKSRVTTPRTARILPTAYMSRSTDDATAFIFPERTATAILAFSILHWVRFRCGTNEWWCVNGYERLWCELYMVRNADFTVRHF